MNGLRQLRDATGGHQVGWKSPTVDDDKTYASMLAVLAYCYERLYLLVLVLVR